MMASPTINYTSRDFDSIVAALKLHLQAKFPTTWRDFYEAGSGMALLELIAYCFTGDTRVSLLNGAEVPIKDLVGLKEFWVYSCTPEGKIVPGLAYARQIGIRNDLVRVTLDNMETIDCTKDHLFLCRNGSYKRASELVVGDSLMPLYRRRSVRGLDTLNDYVLYKDNSTDRWIYTHHFYKELPAGDYDATSDKIISCEKTSRHCIVHHRDFNRYNNIRENLVYMTYWGHMNLHIHHAKETLGKEAKSPDGRKRRSLLMKKLQAEMPDIMGSYFRSELHAQRSRVRMTGSTMSPKANIQKSMSLRRFHDLIGFSFQTLENMRLAAIKRWQDTSMSRETKRKISRSTRGVSKTEDHNANISYSTSLWWATAPESTRNYRSRGFRKFGSVNARRNNTIGNTYRGRARKTLENLVSNNVDIQDWDRYVELYNKSTGHQLMYKDTVVRYLGLEFVESTLSQSSYNHTVSSITPLDGSYAVYDLVLKDNPHNFALSVGVFVHNCFDILSYYLDVQANEVYLETARDRENILKIASLVGYKLSTPSPAAVSIDASIPSSESVDVIIREGTQITSAEGVKFEFLSDQVILAGQTTASLLATQGETKSDSFVSDGSSFQKQTLVNTPVIQDTIEAIVGGVLWSEVSSLAYAVADDKVFAVTYDVDDKAHISFGDGTNGKIPPNGETVVVNYRIGGGLVGNIALSEINTNVLGEKDGSSPIEYVTVSLINATYRGTGGADRETIDHAKLWIPRWIRCNNRAVTEYDFDTLASLFSDPTYGSVGWAKSKLRQEIPELNTVDVYIYVRDVNGNPTTPSAGLISALQAYFDNNDGEDAVRIISVDVVVQVGNLVYIDIDASVSPDTGYAFATVKTNVGAAITSLMTGSNIQPGSDFNISKLYESIQNALGVSHAIVNQITASYRTNESLGTGTGAQTQFTKTLVNLPLTPHNVLITTGSLVVTDDGEGNLTGDVDPTGNNTVDYLTGDIDVTFSTPPAGSADVNCQYDYILYYQRGAEEAVSTGAARFTGSLPYHPVVPGSLAFSDGVQTVTDDSNGNLIGDVYATGTIDYDTGYYDFTFLTAPVAGTKLYSTYQQRLKTSSLDLPIGKDQIAVENRVDISTL